MKKTKEITEKKKEFCIIKDCNRPIHVKKHMLCQSHHKQYYRTGKIPNKPIRTYNLLKSYVDVVKNG